MCGLLLCQLLSARAPLERIAHLAHRLPPIPWHVLQGRIVQRGQQLLHHAPQGIIVQSPRHLYLALQGHILASREPLHPRPAPLVVQVLVSQHVIDWVEGLGVLG